MEDREHRIRERAYLIWVQEGCPDSEAERHWVSDEEAINEEDIGDGAADPSGVLPTEKLRELTHPTRSYLTRGRDFSAAPKSIAESPTYRARHAILSRRCRDHAVSHVDHLENQREDFISSGRRSEGKSHLDEARYRPIGCSTWR
jgi:Protein of unknown function (DUF2934)